MWALLAWIATLWQRHAPLAWVRDMPAARIAYERLLLDLIEGDQTLFVRRDEVEAQWDWIDAIRASWAEHAMSPKPYTAGSWGPTAAIALAERNGVTWHE